MVKICAHCGIAGVDISGSWVGETCPSCVVELGGEMGGAPAGETDSDYLEVSPAEKEPEPEPVRICRDCGIGSDQEDFVTGKAWCRPCNRAYFKRKYWADPEHYRGRAKYFREKKKHKYDHLRPGEVHPDQI